jgi:hypothetical protein
MESSFSLCIPPIAFRISERIFTILATCIMTSDPILTAYFVNSFNSLCVYMCTPVVTGQRLGKNLAYVMTELLDASLPVRRVSHQRKSMRSSAGIQLAQDMCKAPVNTIRTSKNIFNYQQLQKTKLRGVSQRANYIRRATSVCLQS